MAVKITVHDKYVEVLEPLGDLQKQIEDALRHYAVEQITAKIAELKRRDEAFKAKYGYDYETFVRRISSDEEFLAHIENDVDKTWELDLAEWEFCHEGVKDWLKKLRDILLR